MKNKRFLLQLKELCIIQDLLSLVMETSEVPDVLTIAGWTKKQRKLAGDWAALEHLYANDHKVKRLKKPKFINPE